MSMIDLVIVKRETVKYMYFAKISDRGGAKIGGNKRG